MGFTFSFPFHQTALDAGDLIRWTKGYSATGVVDQDVIAPLRRACRKKGIKIDDFILINDTVGTLLSGAFENSECTIAVINGNGTNACYIEKISDVTKWTHPSVVTSILINTEWGSFGDKRELAAYYTDVDTIVDKESINPGEQLFEKMVSGFYIGEIVRNTILITFENGIIFCGGLPSKMREANSFRTSLVLHVYNKDVFLRKFNKHFDYNLDDVQYGAIFKVCDAVIRRAAGLCAAGLSALIVKVNRKFSRIAVDGFVFKKTPVFLQFVKEYTQEILPKDFEFDTMLVNDGPGKGAALALCIVRENIKPIEVYK
ncbi:Hexokinase [Thelohanellus kitauei]|uniref:Phosphotransferase n=1 Tax=Thelohanellus kitauei TaxID=669202 RepID=A0A0C2N3Y8_THEKT|nr:Hexokinase [Thelohanellus kitauei]